VKEQALQQRTRAASAAAARARVKAGSTENAEGALRRSRSAEASREDAMRSRSSAGGKRHMKTNQGSSTCVMM